MSQDGRPIVAVGPLLAKREKRPLVLVVDDDQDIADSVADVLRGGGYDVEQASSGAAALLSAARNRPGLVLLDWRLPSEPAGSALVRKLRDTCGFNVPVVVLWPIRRRWPKRAPRTPPTICRSRSMWPICSRSSTSTAPRRRSNDKFFL